MVPARPAIGALFVVVLFACTDRGDSGWTLTVSGTSGGSSGNPSDASTAADSGGSDAAASTGSSGSSTGSSSGQGSTYDGIVLSDQPVAYWAMNNPSSTSEPDLTGNDNTGTYQGSTPTQVAMPNGDHAVDFDGAREYLTVTSTASLSISTTGSLTWEGWIRPDVPQFPHGSVAGYVDWMGKCAVYSPTCEWEARLYDTTNPEGRCNRLSAYVFNSKAGLGSGAFWQPTCGLLQAGRWYHVVGEYTTASQPADCPSAPAYPGAIDIWVDGVEWNQPSHAPTGCMSEYSVVPKPGNSPLNIGTMALDTWFAGGIGKVAIYGHLLTQAQVSNHYEAMTGQQPSGNCAATCSF